MWEIDPDALREAMGAARVNQSELAEAVGLQQPSIGRLLSGETKTSRKLEAIAIALGVFTEDLVKKDAEFGSSAQIMRDRESSPHLGERQLGFRHKPPDRDPDLVEIAQVDIRYGLGGSFLDLTENAEPRLFSRAWLREFTKASPEHLFWAIGDGDSMEPTIRSGEVILIDRSQDTPRLGDGIWAVAIGEIGMVKRLHFPGQGKVELISDNALVPPIHPGEDELQIIGRVVAVVRKL